MVCTVHIMCIQINVDVNIHIYIHRYCIYFCIQDDVKQDDICSELQHAFVCRICLAFFIYIYIFNVFMCVCIHYVILPLC